MVSKATKKEGGKMKVEVLGPGCPKCQMMAKNVEAALRELGISAEVDKVTDIKRIVDMGVMMTPALVVDGQVKVAGKVPGIDEIKGALGG